MFTVNLYAIKDTKGGFSDPVIQLNDAVAVRSFISQCPSIASHINVPIKDFQLWKIGAFDIDSGMLLPDTPVLLYDAATIPDERSDTLDAEPALSDTENI